MDPPSFSMRRSQMNRSVQLCRHSTTCMMLKFYDLRHIRCCPYRNHWRITVPCRNREGYTRKWKKIFRTTSGPTHYMCQNAFALFHRCSMCQPPGSFCVSCTRRWRGRYRGIFLWRVTYIICCLRCHYPLQEEVWNTMVYQHPSFAKDLVSISYMHVQVSS